MQDGPTISNLPPGHNLTTATVEVNMPAPVVTPGSPLVKVLIKYPADWKKDKFFKDGDIKEVSPEAASTFIEIGIATLFNADEVATDEAAVTDVTEGSQEESKVILADPSVLQSDTVTDYDGEEKAATEADVSTETKKGAKKTAGK